MLYSIALSVHVTTTTTITIIYGIDSFVIVPVEMGLYAPKNNMAGYYSNVIVLSMMQSLSDFHSLTNKMKFVCSENEACCSLAWFLLLFFALLLISLLHFCLPCSYILYNYLYFI